MFHVLAWGQNINPAGSMVAITAAREAVVFTADLWHKVPQSMPYLIGAAGLINHASATRAQLRSPTLIADGGYDIEPIVPAGQYESPPIVGMFPESPCWLEPGDQLEAWVSSTPGAAVRHFVHAWIADSPSEPVFEEVFSVRATAAIQQANFVWTAGNFTFVEPLPVGTYIVLGLRCVSLSGQLARLIFRDQWARPGCPIIGTVNGADHERFRNGRLGVWGIFTPEDPPVVELYHGTDAAQSFIFDLARF